mgnify:CR=1 FL=1
MPTRPPGWSAWPQAPPAVAQTSSGPRFGGRSGSLSRNNCVARTVVSARVPEAAADSVLAVVPRAGSIAVILALRLPRSSRSSRRTHGGAIGRNIVVLLRGGRASEEKALPEGQRSGGARHAGQRVKLMEAVEGRGLVDHHDACQVHPRPLSRMPRPHRSPRRAAARRGPSPRARGRHVVQAPPVLSTTPPCVLRASVPPW